jgi:hypothetical protein
MFYRLTGPLVPSFLVNQFVYLEPMDGSLPLYAQVKEINGKTALLQTLKDYTHNKNNVWSVVARNREQNFALNLLMSPDVDFVTLLGQAGTGKTLLALAPASSRCWTRNSTTRSSSRAPPCPWARTSASCPAPRKRRCSPGWARSTTTSKCCRRATTAPANGAAPPRRS